MATRGFGDPRTLLADLDRLEQGTARLGQRLYDLDEATTTGLLTASGSWRGATAERVADATAALAELWPAWAALRDRLGEARDAADRKDWAGLGQLLADPVATRLGDTGPDDTGPDDTGPDDTAPAALGPALGARVDRVHATAAAIEEALRGYAPRVTDLRQRLEGLAARAAELGAEHDTEVHEAEEAVAHLTSLVAGDPLRDDLEREALRAAEEVGEAYALVTTLEAQRDTLPEAVAHAASTLDELDDVATRGSEALARARDRVDGPEGLLAPLEPGVLHDEPMGLAPWLDRLRRTADEGRWRAATIGLHRWQQVADVHLEHARQVLAANEAPVRRRDELRGLLAGLRARAADDGRVEDPDLAELHATADGLLSVAPCRLGAATEAVDAYRRAVLSSTVATTGGSRP